METVLEIQLSQRGVEEVLGFEWGRGMGYCVSTYVHVYIL